MMPGMTDENGNPIESEENGQQSNEPKKEEKPNAKADKAGSGKEKPASNKKPGTRAKAAQSTAKN